MLFVGEEHNLQSSVLRSFLQIRFTLRILSNNICLCILISDPKICKFLSFKKQIFLNVGFEMSVVL
jgi:hypothetical protein